MLRIFCLLFLSTVCTYGYSQDSTERQDQVQYLIDVNAFKSSSEKQLFSDIASGKNTDYLSLFAFSDPSTSSIVESVKQKMDNFQSASELLHQKDFTSKQVKKLYSEIHNSFLSKYIDNPGFGELFQNGNYNCATATALYTLLLDKTSIHYNIRETPQHVYIVAAPDTYNIIFETTAPGARFLDLNDKTKNQFLDYLYANKMI